MERDEKPEDHSRLIIGLLLTALLTGSVYLARNPPLDVKRPANAIGQASHRDVTQAEARLWQDPLGTVMRHRQRLDAEKKEGKGQAVTAGKAAFENIDDPHCGEGQAPPPEPSGIQYTVDDAPSAIDPSSTASMAAPFTDPSVGQARTASVPHRMCLLGAELGRRLLGERHPADQDGSAGTRTGDPDGTSMPIDVLLMGVLVSGAPYAEVEEHRRRARHAVLAGLNAAGYVPRDAMHIQYVDGPRRAGDAEGGVRVRQSGSPDFLAYEWLDPEERRYRQVGLGDPMPTPSRVLLLWLDEDLLGRDLHESMRQLSAGLARAPEAGTGKAGHAVGGAEGRRRFRVSVMVLGPNDSDSLLALERALPKPGRAEASGPGGTAIGQRVETESGKDGVLQVERVRYFPALATARSQMLPRTWKPLGDALVPHHQSFVLPVIGHDTRVALALRDELLRRGLYGRGDERPRPGGEPHGQVDDSPDAGGRPRAGGEPKARPPGHVALIHEWDTYYGRALVRRVAETLCQFSGEGLNAFPPQPVDPCARGRLKIHEFSYLRGLDGQEPSTSGTVDARGPAVDGKRDERGRGIEPPDGTERPDGQRQFDYLQRLAARLKAEDDDRRARGEGRLEAVGLLGNDVYDKLVLLRALREQLPDAVFFTTDMDARLFHPQEIKWTRGLLVASSFGLELAPALQTDTPPFRDSHQTALYFATLVGMTSMRACAEDDSGRTGRVRTAASDPCPDRNRLPFRVNDWLRQPRVFEIGLTDAVDLTPASTGTGTPPAGGCGPSDLFACAGIHPEPPSLHPTISDGWARVIVLGVPLLLGLLALESLRVAPGPGARPGLGRWREAAAARTLARRAPVVHPRSPARRKRALSMPLAALAALAALALWMNAQDLWTGFGRWLTENGNGEPLLLRDGISMWPQWGLRLAILLLSLHFVLRVLGRLQRNGRAVTEDLVDPESLRQVRGGFAAADAEYRDRHGTAALWWRRLRCMLSLRLDRHPPVDASAMASTGLSAEAIDFWHRYQLRASPGARLLRAALAALAYFFLGRLLLATDGPPVFPFRGDRHAELLPMVIGSVPVMLLLVFLVLDAIILNLRFMGRLHRRFDLTDAPPAASSGLWPVRTRDEHAKRTGLPAHLLDDWIGLYFIARRTEAITPLVFYPAVAVSLSILAAHLRDDGRTMPLMLWFLLGACLLAMLAAAIWLRLRAERFREDTIARLEAARAEALGDPASGNLPERIQLLESRIRSLRRGAFAPYGQQPVFAAILLPLGSLGGVPIAEALVRTGL